MSKETKDNSHLLGNRKWQVELPEQCNKGCKEYNPNRFRLAYSCKKNCSYRYLTYTSRRCHTSNDIRQDKLRRFGPVVLDHKLKVFLLCQQTDCCLIRPMARQAIRDETHLLSDIQYKRQLVWTRPGQDNEYWPGKAGWVDNMDQPDPLHLDYMIKLQS